jgi:hypothetical protein
VLLCCVFIFSHQCIKIVNVVQHVTNVIAEYQRGLSQLPYVPRSSYGRDTLGSSGDANKTFLAFLFSDHATGVEFLKDVGLLRSNVLCNSCSCQMILYAYPTVPDGFKWRSRRRIGGTRCDASRSIRHSSWFHKSNLNFQEVLYLTYDILPSTSNMNITSVSTPLLSGVISSERQCWFFFFGELRS